MSNLNVFFNQTAGIGDIFFLMKQATIISSLGYNVYWPINKEISYLKEYLIIPNNIFFLEENKFDDYPKKYIFLDFQNADKIMNSRSLLVAKYDLIDKHGIKIDHRDWKDYLKFKRNYEKEKELYYNVLGLKDGQRFSLYNRKYGTPPYFKEKKNMKDSQLHKVEMFISSEFTIFDWLMVVERAEEIHIVDSSLTYLIENLTLAAYDDKIHLYSRYTEEVGHPKWHHAADLFQKKWIYEEI